MNYFLTGLCLITLLLAGCARQSAPAETSPTPTDDSGPANLYALAATHKHALAAFARGIIEEDSRPTNVFILTAQDLRYLNQRGIDLARVFALNDQLDGFVVLPFNPMATLEQNYFQMGRNTVIFSRFEAIHGKDFLAQTLAGNIPFNK